MNSPSFFSYKQRTSLLTFYNLIQKRTISGQQCSRSKRRTQPRAHFARSAGLEERSRFSARLKPTETTFSTKGASLTRKRLIVFILSIIRCSLRSRKIPQLPKATRKRHITREVISLARALLALVPAVSWVYRTLNGKKMKRCYCSSSSSKWLAKEINQSRTSPTLIGLQWGVWFPGAPLYSAKNDGSLSKISRARNRLGRLVKQSYSNRSQSRLPLRVVNRRSGHESQKSSTRQSEMIENANHVSVASTGSTLLTQMSDAISGLSKRTRSF